MRYAGELRGCECLRLILAWFAVLFFARAAEAERPGSGSVVLYRLTRCCPESAWTEAEYAVLKELDAMDVSVTLLERETDAEEGLESEISEIGRSGDSAALLYFFKDRAAGLVGVRLAIFERSQKGVSPRWLLYTIAPSVGAVSIVTLKAVEAVREVLTGPAPEAAPVEARTAAASESTAAASNESVPAPARETAPPPEKETKVEKREKEERQTKAPKLARVALPPVAPHRFAVTLGPSAVWSQGGAGSSFALDGGGNVRLFSDLYFDLRVTGTLVSKEFHQDEFDASYHMVLFQAGLFWSFLHDKRFHPLLAARGGPVLMIATGLNKSIEGNQNDVALVWILGGEVGLGIDLSDAWGLLLGAELGAFIPEASIWFIHDQVAVIGRPILNAGIRLEYRF